MQYFKVVLLSINSTRSASAYTSIIVDTPFSKKSLLLEFPSRYLNRLFHIKNLVKLVNMAHLAQIKSYESNPNLSQIELNQLHYFIPNDQLN